MFALTVAAASLLLLLCRVTTSHLTNNQLKSINRLIQHPKITQYQRVRLDNVLYRSYEKWAVKKAKDFRQLHRNKCRNIAADDLVLSSKIGLLHAIRRYDGTASLLNYANFYVRGELFRMVTAHYDSSIVPRKMRAAAKANFTNEVMQYYHNHLETRIIDYRGSDFIGSRPAAKKHDYDQMWHRVAELDLFSQQVMRLKYSHEFEKLMTNAEVAQHVGKCQETVRMTVKRALSFLLE
jgi:RNA polymerase sigma factor (sigma-70 family)